MAINYGNESGTESHRRAKEDEDLGESERIT